MAANSPAKDSLNVISVNVVKHRVVQMEEIQNNTGKQGIVKLNICIDLKGTVVAAQYAPKGSNTLDKDLIKLALDNVRKWTFLPGTVEKECGTITYDFRLK